MFCFPLNNVHNKHESIELFKQVQFQLTPSLVKIFANSCSILNMWVAKSCLGLCHHWVTGGYLSVGCAVVCSLVTSGGPPSSAAGGASNRKGRGKAITSEWVTHKIKDHIYLYPVQLQYHLWYWLHRVCDIPWTVSFYLLFLLSKRKLWRANYW